VVEHDEDAIRSADFVVDMGPGAGEHGGYVIVAGPPSDILKHPDSLTGQYLSGQRAIPLPAQRHAPDPARQLTLCGARGNNLQEVTVHLPVGLLICSPVSPDRANPHSSTIPCRPLQPVISMAVPRTPHPMMKSSGSIFLTRSST
jgi:Excinuclease ABC subunit A